ncbi:MAG: lysophospholipid acyltransferase family protein [Bacteroidota bacterium]
MRRIVRWLVRVIVDLVATVEIHGYENIPAQGGFVVATNHLGFLDAPMAHYALPDKELFIPVAEKWREIPILRWLGKPLNLIFVDRFNPDLKAMREMMHRMDAGETLIIAPEGTRSRLEQMAEGKPGVAYLAAKFGWPILPVALSGTEDRVFLSNLKRLRRTHVTIRAGEVFRLPPLPRQNRDEFLRQSTDEIMVRIAAMLPERNRGFYAEHPRLRELIARS